MTILEKSASGANAATDREEGWPVSSTVTSDAQPAAVIVCCATSNNDLTEGSWVIVPLQLN
jgi:hypothetical protein